MGRKQKYVHSDKIQMDLPGWGNWQGGGLSKDISKHLKGLLDCESVTKVIWDRQMET